jgi:pheromone shutdown protein TraB
MEDLETLKTLNAMLEQERSETMLDLEYLANLLMRATGCKPGDSIQTAIDRASTVGFTFRPK